MTPLHDFKAAKHYARLASVAPKTSMLRAACLDASAACLFLLAMSHRQRRAWRDAYDAT